MPDSPPAAPAGGADRPHGAGPLSPAGAPTLSSTRYLAWLYSPPSQQPVLGALCEIENEVAASVRPGIDHHVAHARLQWWREEFERLAQGRPVHPLTRSLVNAYGGARGASERAPLAGISGFVDTAVWDLAGATFETRKELTAYCERWAAAMFEPAAAASPADSHASPTSEATHAAPAASVAQRLDAAAGNPASARRSQTVSVSPWRELGAAVREIELLADLAREAHAGRVRVPLDELERAGVDLKGLAKPPWPAPLATLLQGRHEALRASIANGVSHLGREEQPNFRGLLVWAALAWRLSWRAQRALPDSIRQRRYHALTDGWQSWRAARHATAGTLQLR